MEQVNLGYSTKNIPIPSRGDYIRRLIEKTEKFLRSLRWRCFFYLNPDVRQSKKECYGFKSTKSPPQIPELKEFEDGMLDLVRNIRFRYTSNDFLRGISSDLSNIQQDNRLLIPADKTTNFYKLQTDQYDRLLYGNITNDYKKAPHELERSITTNDKTIASQLDLDDRICATAKREAFITLKDHKPSFPNRPTCRLLNPTKPELGKISKLILEKINNSVRAANHLQQWRSSIEVIDWFNNIDNKSGKTFISFDIIEFYPSISKSLLNKALNYAASYYDISQQERDIIIQSKRSLLYYKAEPWCKVNNADFDVTMGSYDGAEACELVGLFILEQLKPLNINVGLYRDDGLAVSAKTPRQTENLKKDICKIFSKFNLRITIEANIKTVNFLDINLDLRDGIHKPYMKPNNSVLYINRNSNHPISIVKNLPISINNRLSTLSANEAVFNQTAPAYQNALDQSGYRYQLRYDRTARDRPQTKNTRQRHRNVTWYNPPFSKSVKTNIGKKFLSLITKCFPTNNKLHPIVNRNNIKLSYSCMRNVGSLIAAHTKKLIKSESTPTTNSTARSCNCRDANNCPLNGQCLKSSVIYQASVSREDNTRVESYIGLTEGAFKSRFNAHTSSFRNANQKNATTLSQYIWSLKEKGTSYSIKWKILTHSRATQAGNNNCPLCTMEKFYIITKPELGTLNTRNELASGCRHRRKHLLSSHSIT